LSAAAPRSLLSPRPGLPLLPALGLAALLHLVVLAAAFWLPPLFDRAHPPRKPIIAHMVALGRPRDPHLLPRKESPPPAAAAAAHPLPAPSTKAAPMAPGKREPSRQELMERAIARAAGRTEPESKEAPDPERAGSATGSPEGTAASAEEGDAYFTAVHDAVLEHYVVPSVISERERLYLSASVIAWIGSDGRILRHEFQTKSGNAFFDQALERAIQQTTLPQPPADLARSLRDNGVVLNFRP
jgi:colicin import membrane protein/protein TonB